MRKTGLFVSGASDVTERRLQEVMGTERVLLFKAAYCPPYEKLEEIKKLQLAYHRALMRREGEVRVAVEITEWQGHEWEEYFFILLKFLSDHGEMHPWLVLTSVKGESYVEALRAIRRISFCQLLPDEVFRYNAEMSDYIRRNARVSDGAAAVLSEVILLAEEAASYTVLETVLEELTEAAGDRPADEEDVMHLLHREGSILAMLAEKFEERRSGRGVQIEVRQLSLPLSE